MRFVHRSVLIGAAAIVLLSGCDFSSPWGSSNGGSEYGATSVAGNSGAKLSTHGFVNLVKRAEDDGVLAEKASLLEQARTPRTRVRQRASRRA